MSDRTEIGLCRINHWFCYGYQKLGTLGFFTSFWGEILSKMQSIWSTLTQNTINTHFLIKNISIKIVQHLTCWHPRWNLMRTGATLVCPSIILTSFLSWVYWNMHSLSNSIRCWRIPKIFLELKSQCVKYCGQLFVESWKTFWEGVGCLLQAAGVELFGYWQKYHLKCLFCIFSRANALLVCS